MKKTLFFLSIGLCGMVYAQQAPLQSRICKAKNLVRPGALAGAENKMPASANNKTNAAHHAIHKSTNTTAATYVPFATSQNLFGLLDASCSQVTYNSDLSMVAVTHRENMSLNFGTGAYETDWSIDGGNTWDTSKAVVNKNWTSRYPNGVILNPAGNTTPSMAYAITCGPHTNGTQWDSTVASSIRLDSANEMQMETLMYPNTTGGVLNTFASPIFEQLTDDSIVHSVQSAWTLNAGSTLFYAWYGISINKGVWSGATNSVTWTSTILRPHLASSGGPTDPFDSNAEVSAVGMAWSQDGSIGYVVAFGNLDSTGYDYCSYQPIVWKTTDRGNTWGMMPMYNFANLGSLTRYLYPTIDSPNVKLPFWDINEDSTNGYAGHGFDLTVDMNGNLHIFGVLESGAIDNPDSGGYTYFPAQGNPIRYVYDVYTTSTGGWQADLLDSLHARGVDPTQTPWTSMMYGALTWGARLQASRSKDGSKVFATWLDDYLGEAEMLEPDITSVGIDISTNMRTTPTQMTNDGQSFFVTVSDIAVPNGSCWDIPCVIAKDPNAVDGTTPINLIYVQGVENCNFNINVGIPEIANSNAGFSITPNYPNPFNKNTRFDINLTNESQVGVVVYNIVGEKVYTMSTQKMANGKHTITLNANSLSSGVYFYTVTVNNHSLTQKMIVE